ncbi:MAG: hypothetical protein AAGB48_01160 [Planctomycetota bacterium]
MANKLTVGMILGMASVLTGMGIARAERAVRADTAEAPRALAADEAAIDRTLKAMYDSISGPVGRERDWGAFDRVFHPDGRMVAYWIQPDGTSASREMTAAEYRDQIGPQLVEAGFTETQLHRVIEVYGSVAHAFSTYRGEFTTPAPQIIEGINSVQLIKTDDGWRVYSLVWQQADETLPIPDRYRPEAD